MLEKIEQETFFIGNVDIPNQYLCPITLEIMEDPVMAADGHTYERAAINQWFVMGRGTSPLTGEVLRHLEVTTNYAMRSVIADFKETLPLLQQKRIEERRTQQLNQDFIMAVQLREEYIQRQFDLKKYHTEALKKNQFLLDKQDVPAPFQENVGLPGIDQLVTVPTEVTREQCDKISIQALINGLPFFQALPHTMAVPKSLTQLPSPLKDGLLDGDFKGVLMSKGLKISYRSNIPAVTEQELNQEASALYIDLQRNLKILGLAGLVSQYSYSVLPKSNTCIIHTSYSIDAEELYDSITECDILPKINSTLDIKGTLSVTLMGKDLKVNYTKKSNVITETEVKDKTTAILAELQQYLKKSSQNSLVNQYSSPETNILFIQTQYTADAQELQEFLEENGFLKITNNNFSADDKNSMKL